MKLLQEASLDDAFTTQMKKAQTAADKLLDIIEKMQAPGSTTKPTRLQQAQLRYLAEDFKKLHEKSK